MFDVDTEYAEVVFTLKSVAISIQMAAHALNTHQPKVRMKAAKFQRLLMFFG